MQAKDIAIVILAAGASRRFGAADKLCAPLGGKPLIVHALEAAKARNPKALIAIVPPKSLDLHQLIKAQGFDLHINPDPDAGQGGSISIGAQAALETGTQAALFLLGDMPFITADYLEDMIAKAGTKSVASQAEEHLQPPMLFVRADLQRLAGLPAHARGRDILGADMGVMPLPKAMARDFDTPQDFQDHNLPNS